MTLRHLKIFVEVAKTGNMSTAAKNCFIAQPTVSQAVRELEEHYHVLLFERLSKHLYITPEGHTLLKYAHKTLDQYQQLEEAIHDMGSMSKIRIGATITIGTCLLAYIVSDLKQRFLSLSTYTYVGNTRDIEQKLLKAELDIGIVEGTIENSDLNCIPIANDFLVLAAGQSHPFYNQDSLSLSELSGQNFVLREYGSGTRQLFTDYMGRKKLTYTIACEAATPETIKQAVIYNNYLTAISVRLLETEIYKKQVKIFINQDNAWNRHFYLVYHKDKIMTQTMKSLTDIMKAYENPRLIDKNTFGYII